MRKQCLHCSHHYSIHSFKTGSCGVPNCTCPGWEEPARGERTKKLPRELTPSEIPNIPKE